MAVQNKVSLPVIKRLPKYYRYLTNLSADGKDKISSSELAHMMGTTASQVRQDFNCFGGFGQQGYGYNIENLRGEISDILGMNRGHNAVILGAGNLGRALMENFHFERSGVALSAAFDVAPDVVGQRLSGVPVHHVDQLEEYLGQHPASIGVLTVPRSVANRIAGRLVASGVKGIWNFTNIELTVDAPDIVIENVHFADSLLALSYMISEVP